MTTAQPPIDDDLVLCHQEPIRTPGSVQPHGVLFALSEAELVVTHVSASVESLLGRAPDTVLGERFGALFGDGCERMLRDSLAMPDGTSAPVERADERGDERFRQLELRFDVGGEPHRADAVLHRVGAGIGAGIEAGSGSGPEDGTVNRPDDRVILELDGIRPAGEGASAPVLSLGALQQINRRLQGARTGAALCEAIVGEVSTLTGFERVMVYRFHDDGHGEVVAERLAADRPPYLGLHYPESDIPAQARELYRRNWIRCIERVPYVPSPIFSTDAEALDLGFAHLRAVSPIHIEYLQNMGVGASMSISLLEGDRLWGLVACHHGEPRRVNATARAACELLGTTFSLLLPAVEATEAAGRAARSREGERLMMERMVDAVPYADGRFGHLDLLAELVAADGVASVSGEVVETAGRVPDEGRLTALAGWLGEAREESVFATASARTEVPGADDWPAPLAGLLAVEISREQRQYLLAFRDEQLQSVDWAGRPDEKHVVTDGAVRRLAPRHSFEAWSQSIHGLSRPWEPHELDAARTLRRTARELIVGTTEQVLRLNRELARSRDDMQSFAHIAAHDLKEPLRGINNYAAFLLEDHGDALDERARARIDSIARLADRGSALTSALLEFAEIGHGPGQREPFDVVRTLANVRAAFEPELERRGITLHIDRSPQELRGERVHFEQVMTNLVGNAVKYADPDKPAPRIDIEILPDDGPLTHRVRVRDNGIGIAPEHHRDVFTLFRRLHGPGVLGGGSGLGLAIVKRIVELSDGELSLDSAPGVGTTIEFTFGERGR